MILKQLENRESNTSMHNSEFEIVKSASGNIKFYQFKVTESTGAKLKSQFHSNAKPKESNAKDLIMKRKMKLNQHKRRGKHLSIKYLSLIDYLHTINSFYV